MEWGVGAIPTPGTYQGTLGLKLKAYHSKEHILLPIVGLLH